MHLTKNLNTILLLILLATSSLWSQIPTNGLVAHYPFNGNANDMSGNSINPITMIGVNYSRNRFVNDMTCATFLGSSIGHGIKIGNPTPLNFGNGSFSYCFWLKTTKSGTSIIRKGFNGIEPGYLSQIRSTDGCMTFAVGSSIGQAAGLRTTTRVNDGLWHFAVCVLDKVSNKMNIYLDGNMTNVQIEYNGVLINNSLDISSLTGLNATTIKDLNIGNLEGGGENFAGLLDECRFYSRALNPSEVQALYSEGCAEYFSQAPTISFDGTNLLTGTYAGANYSWSYNNTTLAGYNSNIYDGTLSAGTYTVTVTNAACVAQSSYNLATDIVNIDKGLKAYYPFNGNANDMSGNGNNGTVVGFENFSKNRFLDNANSISLSGINNAVLVNDNNSLDLVFEASAFSWINIKGQPYQNFTVLTKGNGSVRSYTLQLYRQGSSNQYKMALVTSNVETVSLIPFTIDFNKWYHIGFTFKNKIFSVYLNSVLIENVTVTSNMVVNSAALEIGRDSYSATEFTNGLIDEVRLYSRSLNHLEVQEVYKYGCPGFKASFSYPSNIYGKNITSAPVVGTVTGGYFLSVAGLALNTLTGEVNPSLSEPGTYQVTYFVPAQYGCSSLSGVASITIANSYKILPVSVNDCSTLPFTVPIVIQNTVNSGIVGLDVEMSFNPLVMTPTGLAYLGSVVTSLGQGIVSTYTNGSTLNINISYDGQGELSGSGLIVSPEFLLISGTPAGNYTIGGGNVKQSFVASENDVLLMPELFTVLHYLPTFTGSVFHWGNANNPIINNNNTLSGVLKATALENCSNIGKYAGSDNSGTFSVELGEGNYGVALSRDIPSSSPVIDVINGNDAMLITKIRNGSLANPNAQQLIAADVNGSGSITSGDRTLLRRRTLMIDTQFPNNVPDWKFYNMITTFTGYDKDHIPSVLTCIPLDSYIENGCVKLGNQSFAGVLIGDVDGSYITNFTGGKNLRLASSNVVYDLKSSSKVGADVIEVPVKINYVGTIYAVDAAIEYDNASIKVESISLKGDKNLQKGQSFLSNHFGSNLFLATLDDEIGFDNEGYFFSVKLRMNKSKLSAFDLGNISTYINGEKVNTSVLETTLDVSSELTLANINIYPNPNNTGFLNIDLPFKSKFNFEIINSYGQSVSAISHDGLSSSTIMDISGLNKGVYFLKISSTNSQVVKKLVIE